MQVAQARPDGFTAVEATARGPDVVLGWFVYGTQDLRLARVTP